MNRLAARFSSLAASANELASHESEIDDEKLTRLLDASVEVEASWSHSNLGYQANVYYQGFQNPPPGAHFSREWGFEGRLHGSTGDWQIHTAVDVEQYVMRLAGNPNLAKSENVSSKRKADFEQLIERARSAASITPRDDSYITGKLADLEAIEIPSREILTQSQMEVAKGSFPVRDMRALEGGWQPAAHQQVQAYVMHIKAPYFTARRLALTCEQLAEHLEFTDTEAGAKMKTSGKKVFLGHGGESSEYLKLGVWLGDLGLEWEVYDRKPTAGYSTKERLTEMLDNAQIAFLLMTPEDEASDGKLEARSNVIHEVGLFQGRLGFSKAIVLLEQGCEEFSNIAGLGQIRYPSKNIKAAFEEIRQVLQREGVL